jgi:hypothetical protein
MRFCSKRELLAGEEGKGEGEEGPEIIISRNNN